MTHAANVAEALEQKDQERDGFRPSPEQQSVVDNLVALQEEMKAKRGRMTDEQFVKLLRIGGGASRWSVIRSGKYWDQVKNQGTIFADLRRAFERYQANYQYSLKFEGKTFVENDAAMAVLEAVKECAAKPFSDRKRIVVYLAETGGGKSMLAWQLQTQFQAIVATASAGWKTASGWKALIDICRQLPFCVPTTSHRAPLEALLLSQLQGDQYILVIDEAEYFGKGIIDSFKKFINESKTVIVILAIPEAYRKWNALYPMEARQLATRTHAIFDGSHITSDMAIPFLERLKWRAEADKLESAAFVTSQANLLGGLELIDTTVARLSKSKEPISAVAWKSAQSTEVARMIAPPVHKGCK